MSPYDIIGQCSIRSAATLRRPRCGSGLAATLPSTRLCRPGPALAEALGPDPFRLVDRHHPGADGVYSKVSDPLASPPDTLLPFASVLSLNPKF